VGFWGACFRCLDSIGVFTINPTWLNIIWWCILEEVL
jgi:hypothetical protein